MHCLDSDFLIEVLRREPRAVAALADIEAEGRPHASVITAMELTDTDSAKARAAALDALGTLVLEPIDGSVAIAASAMSQRLRRVGREVPRGDLLIAATCVLRDLELVSRNRRHFARIPRLRLRAW